MGREGLVNKSERPVVSGDPADLFISVSGNDTNQGVAWKAPEWLEEIDPCSIGKPQIKKNEIRFLLAGGSHSLLRCVRGFDLITFVLQDIPEKPSDFFLIINDKDFVDEALAWADLPKVLCGLETLRLEPFVDSEKGSELFHLFRQTEAREAAPPDQHLTSFNLSAPNPRYELRGVNGPVHPVSFFNIPFHIS